MAGHSPVPRLAVIAAIALSVALAFSASPAWAVVASCSNSTCPDSGWSAARWAAHAGYPSNGGIADGANCTNYAAWRLMQDGIAEDSVSGFGAASAWATSAQASGYTVNQTAAVGAIAQWNSGHVAYVEQINSNGTIVVSESNVRQVNAPPLWLRHQSISPSSVSNFIHFGTTAPTTGISKADWRLANVLGGSADESYSHGRAGDIPIAGDWNGDGIDTPGVVRDGQWILTNIPGGGQAFASFTFGKADDQPIVGDWDGNGTDTPGVHRGATWILSNSFGTGTAFGSYFFGKASDTPLVGDWDGDGKDTFGVHRGATWIVTNTYSSAVTQDWTFGKATDDPIIGDWNGDGIDTFGVHRAETWILTNGHTSSGSLPAFTYGRPTDLPLVGDWNDDGTETIGIAR